METITSHTFLAPKRDYALEECQDSIYPQPGKGSSGLFAIADGVTTSFLPGQWAQELTRHFSERGVDAFTDWDAWIEHPRKDWLERARKLAEKEDANLFTKNKFAAREPASATFVGLKLEERTSEGLSWRALLLGDSCLFHLAADGEVTPYTSSAEETLTSDDFGFITAAACSYATTQSDFPALVASSSTDGGQCPLAKEGDFFILATDALSKWLILRHELDRPVWGTLVNLTKDEEFDDFIARIREDDPCLDDDDVALVVIRIGQPHASYLEFIYEPPVMEKSARAAASEAPEFKLEGLSNSHPASPAEEKPKPAKKKSPRTTWAKVNASINAVSFRRRAGFALMALGFVSVDIVLAFWWGKQQAPAQEALPAMVANTPAPLPPKLPAVPEKSPAINDHALPPQGAHQAILPKR